jgi:nitric oxide reductase NorE protein
MTNPLRADYDLPEFLAGSDGVDDVARPPSSRPVSSRPGHIPGEAGLWIFILGDMTIFAAILLVFLWERRSDQVAFTASAHQLIQPIGGVNTLILLLSSYLVVRALVAHRAGRHSHARRLIFGAIGCAALFAGLKAVEYSREISTGHTPASGMFYTFYFILTGLHLLHVIIGAGLLTAWQRALQRPRPWAVSQKLVEGIASYWHMVDLLWVAIFALVYLVSAE